MERVHIPGSSRVLQLVRWTSTEQRVESRFPAGASGSERRYDVRWTLIPEPSNPHDRHAVMVHHEGSWITYVPAENARRLQTELRKLEARGLHAQFDGTMTVAGTGTSYDWLAEVSLPKLADIEHLGTHQSAARRRAPAASTAGSGRALVLFLVSLLFGLVGADRFVSRQPVLGVVKLLTAGGLGVWWLVDVVIFGVRYVKEASPARM